eukprot:g6388.t1
MTTSTHSLSLENLVQKHHEEFNELYSHVQSLSSKTSAPRNGKLCAFVVSYIGFMIFVGAIFMACNASQSLSSTEPRRVVLQESSEQTTGAAAVSANLPFQQNLTHCGHVTESELAQLPSYVASLQATVQELQADVATLMKANMGTLPSVVAALNASVVKLQCEVTALFETDLGTLTDDVEALKASLTALQSDLTSVPSKSKATQKQTALSDA